MFLRIFLLLSLFLWDCTKRRPGAAKLQIQAGFLCCPEKNAQILEGGKLKDAYFHSADVV